MEELFNKSTRLTRNVQTDKVCYLYGIILWANRLIGINGARGMGETTLVLKRLKVLKLPAYQAVYWTLDDLYFTNGVLFTTAQKYYNEVGRCFLLDEVHKYPQWTQHIKKLYDQYDDLKIVFTGSSIIETTKEEADLSRRALMYTFNGMSYREYLHIKHKMNLPVITFEEIIDGTNVWQDKSPQSLRTLGYFTAYLQKRYYPCTLDKEDSFTNRLQQVIRIIIGYDMANLQGFDVRNAQNMLQFLYILSDNVSFKPNVTELVRKTDIHRNTINSYLHFLEDTKWIRLIYLAGISVSTMQKPEKILQNNTNLAFALVINTADKDNQRETFWASQLAVNHKISLPVQGDFVIDDTYTFEIGGKKKKVKQIKNIEKNFLVVAGQDYPVRMVSLWGMGY